LTRRRLGRILASRADTPVSAAGSAPGPGTLGSSFVPLIFRRPRRPFHGPTNRDIWIHRMPRRAGDRHCPTRQLAVASRFRNCKKKNRSRFESRSWVSPRFSSFAVDALCPSIRPGFAAPKNTTPWESQKFSHVRKSSALPSIRAPDVFEPRPAIRLAVRLAAAPDRASGLVP